MYLALEKTFSAEQTQVIQEWEKQNCVSDVRAAFRKFCAAAEAHFGLGYFKYGLCAGCFEALTTVCTEQDDTLAEQRCVALTDDGVHAAAMLLSAYRAGAGCRLSQADAAWVRNVIADSENFLPDLLREVP